MDGNLLTVFARSAVHADFAADLVVRTVVTISDELRHLDVTSVVNEFLGVVLRTHLVCMYARTYQCADTLSKQHIKEVMDWKQQSDGIQGV